MQTPCKNQERLKNTKKTVRKLLQSCLIFIRQGAASVTVSAAWCSLQRSLHRPDTKRVQRAMFVQKLADIQFSQRQAY